MFRYFFITFLAWASVAWAASLQQVNGWGSGPQGTSMYIYVPDRVATNPAIIVMAHTCGGSAQAMFGMSRIPSQADQYGFILIYPQATRDSNCWDVYSRSSLTRDGGGDSTAIKRMVDYTLDRYNGDASRVYAVGSSSGAMMANVLAAVYPDVFEAVAVFSGVPAGCMWGAPAASPGMANQTCAQGQIQRSAQEWGNFARSMAPGYSGRRTRMQIWHGTGDFLVRYETFTQQLAQWSNVLGLSLTREVAGTPSGQYTQMIYGSDGSQLVGYSGNGVGHPVPIQDNTVLSFFGLLGGTSPPPPGVTTTTTGGGGGNPPPPTITPPPPPPVGGGPSQSVWGQCGGSGYNGPTACVSTATCTTQNPWYAQCVPR